jgi:hypothetical protein
MGDMKWFRWNTTGAAGAAVSVAFSVFLQPVARLTINRSEIASVRNPNRLVTFDIVRPPLNACSGKHFH